MRGLIARSTCSPFLGIPGNTAYLIGAHFTLPQQPRSIPLKKLGSACRRRPYQHHGRFDDPRLPRTANAVSACVVGLPQQAQKAANGVEFDRRAPVSRCYSRLEQANRHRHGRAIERARIAVVARKLLLMRRRLLQRCKLANQQLSALWP